MFLRHSHYLISSEGQTAFPVASKKTHHGVFVIAARCARHRGTLSLPSRHGVFPGVLLPVLHRSQNHILFSCISICQNVHSADDVP